MTSRMDYSINPNDGINEHFGTLVGYENLPAIHLTQQAYVNNYGTDGAVRYYATGVDDAGNEYRITWETTAAWDAANEEAKTGDAPPLLDDESNACDWDTPYDVRLVQSGQADEHDILITVSGGVAQIATAPQQAQVYIFDYDNYKHASVEERAEMLDELPEHLRRLINE